MRAFPRVVVIAVSVFLAIGSGSVRPAIADEPPEALPAAPAVSATPTLSSEDDVRPTLDVYSANDVTVAVGALIQLYLAPYVGSDSLIDNGDPAVRAGFRLRRARFGLEAHYGNDYDFLLVLNPLQTDPETGAISDARLTYTPRPWVDIWAGATKVPFTHAELVSSADLTGVERPLSAQTLVPQNRLGAGADFWLADRSFRLTVGLMNATEGYALGNQLTGFIGVGRVEWLPRLGAARLSVGVGGYAENGATTTVFAGSANVGLEIAGLSLLVEALTDHATPVDAPPASPGIADETTRRGAYVEAGYLLRHDLQVVARFEYLDDNTAVDDAGDVFLLDAGLNYRMSRMLRMQLHYIGRYERYGVALANDSVILNLQGEL